MTVTFKIKVIKLKIMIITLKVMIIIYKISVSTLKVILTFLNMMDFIFKIIPFFLNVVGCLFNLFRRCYTFILFSFKQLVAGLQVKYDANPYFLPFKILPCKNLLK